MRKALCYTFFVLICGGSHFPSFAQVITTFAGNGLTGTSGDGGLADTAKMFTPSGVAIDKQGNVYISDQNGNRIRKVNTAGIISTVAGTGVKSHTGDGGPATDATLYWPTGVAVDRIGNIYIADQFNYAIRKVDTFGIISTIAGTGASGYFGDGGPATDAKFWHPADVGVDTTGNVYIADQDNHAIRKVDTYGIITTIGGIGTAGYGGDGGAATLAQLNFPAGISVDQKGNVYIADLYNSRVRKIDPAGIIRTVAGDGSTGYGGDGGAATAAQLNDVSAVAVDSAGNIYLTDYHNFMIRKVNSAGIISTIAGNGTSGYGGDGGLATLATLGFPEGVAVDTAGNVYIADYGNARVRKVEKHSIALANHDPVVFNSFSPFPNPSSGHMVVQSPDHGLLEIYNSAGLSVYSNELEAGMNEINISEQPPGVYLLYLVSRKIKSVQKVVINK